MTTMPPSTLASRPQPKVYRRQTRSVIRPITNAPTGQLSRQPAVGPANTERPPRPPGSSGSPTATSTRNSSWDRKPRRAPTTDPASITPSVCAVMGTGPTFTAGTSPSTAVIAANSATWTRSLLLTRRKVPEGRSAPETESALEPHSGVHGHRAVGGVGTGQQHPALRQRHRSTREVQEADQPAGTAERQATVG